VASVVEAFGRSGVTVVQDAEPKSSLYLQALYTAPLQVDATRTTVVGGPRRVDRDGGCAGGRAAMDGEAPRSVLSIVRAKTSVAEAGRKHGLTVAEIEDS